MNRFLLAGLAVMFGLSLSLAQDCNADYTEFASICDGDSYEWLGSLYTDEDVYCMATSSDCGGCSYQYFTTIAPGGRLDFLIDSNGNQVPVINGPDTYCNNMGPAEVADNNQLETLIVDAIVDFYPFCNTDQVYVQHEYANGCVTFHIYNAPAIFTIADFNNTIQDPVFEYDCQNQIRLELDLTVHELQVTDLDEEICEDDSFIVGTSEYKESGSYSDTLTDQYGCDSIVNLTLTVHELQVTELDEEICDGESYTVGMSNYTESGMYTDTIPDQYGCDSTVNLVLIVHELQVTALNEEICEGESYEVGTSSYTESGPYTDIIPDQYGCDSTVNLMLIVHELQVTDLDEEICDGESYVVGMSTYIESGMYTDTIPDQYGCDSTVNLTLTVHELQVTDLDEEICDGESYEIGSDSFTDSGPYTVVLTDQYGCDSTVNLLLTVHELQVTDLDEEICDGESYEVGSESFTDSGPYTVVLSDQHGCDSTVNLTLLVHELQETDLNEEICEGESYEVGSESFTESGSYPVVLPDQHGCDSTINLMLLVHELQETDLDEEICEGESYEVGDESFTDSGAYTIVLSDQHGCDSTINLTLLVHELQETDLDEEICEGESYTVGTSIYTESGSTTDILTDQYGCDSTVNLMLTVHELQETDLDEEICEGESFEVGDESFTDSGSYTIVLPDQHDCDSTINLMLTVHELQETDLDEEICSGESYEVGDESFTDSGSYIIVLPDQNDCDSTINLMLTVHELQETDLDEEICSGESYEVGDESFTDSGSYIIVLSDQHDCDSTVNLMLTVHELQETDLDEEICEGESYEVGTSSYTVSGSYIDVILDQYGCDSTVMLDLLVFPTTPNQTTDSIICDGDIVEFFGSEYSSSGTYEAEVFDINNCPYSEFLFLTVLTDADQYLDELICVGDTLYFNGTPYFDEDTYTIEVEGSTGCEATIILELFHYPVTQDSNLEFHICQGDTLVFDNQEYTEAGFYSLSQEDENGCSYTVNINLLIDPSYQESIQGSACLGDSIFIDESWYYSDTMFTLIETTLLGCDSIIDYTLDFISYPIDTSYYQICQGDSLMLYNMFVYDEGIYDQVLQSSMSCDSLVVSQVDYYPHDTTVVNLFACYGDTLLVNDTPYYESGTYEQLFESQYGCDSLLIVDVVISDQNILIDTETICFGETWMFNGITFDSTGIYSDTLTSTLGCDSIEILDLTVLEENSTEYFVNICQGQSYDFQGLSLNQSGMYRDTLTSVRNCDSILVLDLLVSDTLKSFLDAEICFGTSYQFGESLITESGVYTSLTTSSLGCDSLTELALTVKDEITYSFSDQICMGDSLTFEGQILDTQGVYMFATPSMDGCDSTVILTLEVVEMFESSLTVEICTGDTFIYNGIEYSGPGNYTQNIESETSCDTLLNIEVIESDGNIEVSHQIGYCQSESVEYAGLTYNQPGNYTVDILSSESCDTTVLLTVVEYQTPTVNIEMSGSLCQGSSVQLTVDGDWIDVEWNLQSDSQVLTVTESGFYSAVVTDVNGCTAMDQIVLDFYEVSDDISIATLNSDNCEQDIGSIQIEGSADNLYSLDGGMTWFDGLTMTDWTPGLYELLISNVDTTCVLVYEFEVDIPSFYDSYNIGEIQLLVDTIPCELASNSLIIEFENQDDFDVLYSIDNGDNYQTSAMFNNLPAGDYQITVSIGEEECAVFDNIELTIPNYYIDEIELSVTEEVGCFGQENGGISLSNIDDISNYDIEWSNSIINQSEISNLPAGEYSVTVSNAFCFDIQSIVLQEPNVFEFDEFEINDTSLCSEPLLYDLSEDYNYSLYFENVLLSDDNQFEISTIGNYILEVTNERDCVDTIDFTVESQLNEDAASNFLLSDEGLIDTDIVAIDISLPLPDSLSWTYDGASLVEIVNNTCVVSYDIPGVYTIILDAYYGDCFESVVKTIKVVETHEELTNPLNYTSTFNKVEEFTLSPNPSTGQFNLSVTLSEEADIEIVLFDYTSDIIDMQSFSGSESYNIEYDISDYPNGQYGALLKFGAIQQYILFMKVN